MSFRTTRGASISSNIATGVSGTGPSVKGADPISVGTNSNATNTPGTGHSQGGVFQDLSSRASGFRSKLLEEFRIFENGYLEAPDRPIYSTHDFSSNTDPAFLKVLRENPHQMIKFKPFHRQKEEGRRHMDKRLTRIRNLNSLPVGVWAKVVVYHPWFQNLVFCLILLNAALLGLTTELEPSVYYFEFDLISIVSHVSLGVYVIEIALKWLDSFEGFWKDGWNIFDLLITAVSAIPLGGIASGRATDAARLLRVIRTFRSFKLIVRFPSLRLIVETLLRAFQSLGFILMFLAIITYIFAVLAINLFEKYTYSPDPSLAYKDKFSSLGNALVTLFQLLTLDQWYKIHNDISTVADSVSTLIFFILWVFVGAFIFRNVFVGVMVKNFQTINSELLAQSSRARRDRNLRKHVRKLTATLQKRTNSITSLLNAANGPGSDGVSSAGSSRNSSFQGGGTLDQSYEVRLPWAGLASPTKESPLPVNPTASPAATRAATPGTPTKTAMKAGTSGSESPSKGASGQSGRGNGTVSPLANKAPNTIKGITTGAPPPPFQVGGTVNSPTGSATTNHGGASKPETVRQASFTTNAWYDNKGVHRRTASAQSILRNHRAEQQATTGQSEDNTTSTEDPRVAEAKAQIVWLMANVMKEDQHGAASEWENVVEKALGSLTSKTSSTLWPRDTLFTYFQTMDRLQENMKEFQELQGLSSLALLSMHDT